MKTKPGMTGMGDGKPKPPGMGDEPAMPKDTEQAEGGKKHSPEEALVIRAEKHCDKCENYDPTSGSCSEVEGMFAPDDACLRFFEPMGADDQDELGANDAGAPSDNDADNVE